MLRSQSPTKTGVAAVVAPAPYCAPVNVNGGFATVDVPRSGDGTALAGRTAGVVGLKAK